ncbi:MULTISPECIES: hypothetical protein [unclassified Streptomyces]
MSSANHRHEPETCKNTPYLTNRHGHQPTNMEPTIAHPEHG